MLHFERTAKGYQLTGAPTVFGIFYAPGGTIALAGYTPNIDASDAPELCRAILLASSESMAKEKQRNGNKSKDRTNQQGIPEPVSTSNRDLREP